MAEIFNATRYPFLKVIGRDVNPTDFYINCFRLNGWEDADEEKLQQKIHREWYDAYKDKFLEQVVICRNGYWHAEADDSDTGNLSPEMLLCVRNKMPDEYEESGVFMHEGVDVAYAFTVTFHSQEYIEKMAEQGIETSTCVVRLISMNTKGYKCAPKWFAISGLTFIDHEKDEAQTAISYAGDERVSREKLERCHQEFKVISKTVANYVALKYVGAVKEYELKHGQKGDGDVIYPFINYTNLKVSYIYALALNKLKTMVSKEKFAREVVMESDSGNTVYTNDICAYEVEHTPIDWVVGTQKQYTTYRGKNWGLDKVFCPLKEDSPMYKKLYDKYHFDEPGFIGGMNIPITYDMEMKLCKVYVVRCHNNGTTYFLSDNLNALKGFMS